VQSRSIDLVSLVTGGTEGIGRAVALDLARKGHRVLFVGRDCERGREVLAELTSIIDRGHRFIPADLSLLRATANVVREVEYATHRLDSIVCCAGILSTIPAWTPERMERTFALNYLSRYLLARQLLPMLEAAPSGRIVLVANAGMYKDTLDLDDLQYRRGKPGLDVSARSQFANDLLAIDLAERLRGRKSRVEATCVYPGMVKTRVFANALGLPWFFRALVPVLRVFQMSPAIAAETPVFLAHSAEAVGTNGRFYGPRCRPRIIPDHALNVARRRRLIELSDELVRPFVDAPAPIHRHPAATTATH
jgi:NAD(P)-dependent dehydrogenase (short-subunit alcohol dehydrogenase family)